MKKKVFIYKKLPLSPSTNNLPIDQQILEYEEEDYPTICFVGPNEVYLKSLLHTVYNVKLQINSMEYIISPYHDPMQDWTAKIITSPQELKGLDDISDIFFEENPDSYRNVQQYYELREFINITKSYLFKNSIGLNTHNRHKFYTDPDYRREIIEYYSMDIENESPFSTYSKTELIERLEFTGKGYHYEYPEKYSYNP